MHRHLANGRGECKHNKANGSTIQMSNAKYHRCKSDLTFVSFAFESFENEKWFVNI